MTKHLFLIPVFLALVFRIDVEYLGEPMWILWGNSANVHYDEDAHVWINKNPSHENIFRAMDLLDDEPGKYTSPERVPEKREHRLKFREDLFYKPEYYAIQTLLATPERERKRRFVLINVEDVINTNTGTAEAQYRVWPHLGILYVGTIAHEEGYEVLLWDEVVQGYADIEQLVKPGDIVGLGLVVTGMDRGIKIARQVKNLGANYVIAGNDSAIFRSDQILSIPDKPIDAVFTSNSLSAVRSFFQQSLVSDHLGNTIPGVATSPEGRIRANEQRLLQSERAEWKARKSAGEQDTFCVPEFDLFPEEYWQEVWRNYRLTFGHKHKRPGEVKNALALLAQGCTRTGDLRVCDHCAIAEVANIVGIPSHEYLEQTLEAYQSFGIDYVFNVTDSSYEMGLLATRLKEVGAYFPEGYLLYGRAWGIAHKPELIERWHSLTGGRLMINVGMESGSERILSGMMDKASQAGSRLKENHEAIRRIKGSGAHLHYSLIFGSPGESHETCRESLEFLEWSRAILGTQLDYVETDIFWLNHGAPASRVFRDYEYAKQLATQAGKEISRETWEHDFHRHHDTLVVPWECEEAWYRHFTELTVEEAQEYNTQVAAIMRTHEGAAAGRAYKPLS